MKRNYLKGLTFSILAIFAGAYLFCSEAKAAGASLYLSPAEGTFSIGGTFNVSIFVNTGAEDVNAVEVNLKFDPKKLQIASPTTGRSFIKVWVAQPSYSNTQGTMSFLGGIPSPGINTSSGLVSTITFRVMAPGQTTILFSESSKVLRNDERGTNILTSMGRGVYDLTVPPPEGPKVYSPTHPDQNKWYKDNNPTFSWEKEAGVTDFSYSFDLDSTGVPDNFSEGDFTSISYSQAKDGIWYFHVKAEKNGIWGGASHYLVQIDSTPPAAFSPIIEPGAKTAEKQPLVSFLTTDALSGLDHYALKYLDITAEKGGEDTGFFTEVSGPYKLPILSAGNYLVVVRAYDVAGNFREGTAKIQILPDSILFSAKGIQLKYFLISWWLIILIPLIIILLFLLSLWIRQRRFIEEKKEKINEIKNKLETRQSKQESNNQTPNSNNGNL